MTTGVWNGYRLKFRSPRHAKVVPNQNTTEATTVSLSQALLLFNEEVKTPQNEGEYRNLNQISNYDLKQLV